MNTDGRILLVFMTVVFLNACHHHPARVEDYSSTHTKRKLPTHGSYRVRRGDTLYAIAFRYGLDHRTVAVWNNIPSPYIIYPGQKLRLSAPPTKKTRSHRKRVVKDSPAKKPVTKHTGSSSGKQARSSHTNTGQAATGSSYAADPDTWLWPSKGKIIRTFVAANPARNGLDIAGRQGQSVRASAAGKVVYSGNGLLGYGELIIIKHSERMLSAYAHNRVRLVQEGVKVIAGQKIAEMGRNDQNEQLLHFEIRVRGKPVDPLAYLPKK